MRNYLAILALVFPLLATAHDLGEENLRKAREYCSARHDVGDRGFDQCMAGQLRK